VVIFNRRISDRRGMALVLTLALLGLLVLLIVSMAALSKTDARTGLVALQQTQARQHALLGLRVALAELQRHAGPDEALTGMAGITGMPAGAGRPARHWCGVWSAQGALITWLASGGSGGNLPDLSGDHAVALLSVGSLGADATDKEHVRALKLAVEVMSEDGSFRTQGNYAYWIGDEGVKLSAIVNGHTWILPGVPHAINELVPALAVDAPRLANVLTYVQLAFVPASPLTPGPLQSNLHSLTVAHARLSPTALGLRPLTGAINVNTTAVRLWRGVAATYNLARPGAMLAITTTTFANRMRDGLPLHAGAGKNPGGPFQSAESFHLASLLDEALAGSGVSRIDFLEAVGGLFTARSDTLRIRAYGDAVTALTPGEPAAVAYCEAMVQRTTEDLPGFGRRFRVTGFRWLGPGDI
jgi:hypothetical protein